MAPHAQIHVSAHLVAFVAKGMIVKVFEPFPDFDYFKSLVRSQEGLIHLPDRPGLGIEIDEETVRKAKPVSEMLPR